MLATLIVLAQQQTQEGPPWYSSVLMMLAILMLGYFLLMRPAQRAEQQRRALIGALKKNDRIVNSGGIIGVVEAIKEKEDEVILKGGLHVLKSSIVRVLTADEPVKDDKDK